MCHGVDLMSHHLFSCVHIGNDDADDHEHDKLTMSKPASTFHSYSVPTSPAPARLPKGVPVTPQRYPRQQQRQAQTSVRSPTTPSTPYTPLSIRGSDSAGSSSTLTTPDNTSFLARKRLNGHSPDIANESVDAAEANDKSLADLAKNWRARATQHGIKVTTSTQGGVQDMSHFGDDEGTCARAYFSAPILMSHLASDKTTSDIGNDSSIISNDEGRLHSP